MQYSAKTVLRLIPNETLARLFAPHPAFAGFNWNRAPKHAKTGPPMSEKATTAWAQSPDRP